MRVSVHFGFDSWFPSAVCASFVLVVGVAVSLVNGSTLERDVRRCLR